MRCIKNVRTVNQTPLLHIKYVHCNKRIYDWSSPIASGGIDAPASTGARVAPSTGVLVGTGVGGSPSQGTQPPVLPSQL